MPGFHLYSVGGADRSFCVPAPKLRNSPALISQRRAQMFLYSLYCVLLENRSSHMHIRLNQIPEDIRLPLGIHLDLMQIWNISHYIKMKGTVMSEVFPTIQSLSLSPWFSPKSVLKHQFIFFHYRTRASVCHDSPIPHRWHGVIRNSFSSSAIYFPCDPANKQRQRRLILSKDTSS